MTQVPTDGQDAVRHLVSRSFPLTAGLFNGALVCATFVFTLAGLLSPVRTWLKAGGYLITVCGLFTLVLGTYLWIMTLRLKDDFFPTYLEQQPGVQTLIQQSVRKNCKNNPPPSAGKWLSWMQTTGANVLASSSIAADTTMLLCRPLSPIPLVPVPRPLLSFAAVELPFPPLLILTSIPSSRHSLAWLVRCNSDIHQTFEEAVLTNSQGIDAMLVLVIVCRLKERKERIRYRHIDEKSGYQTF